jgi:aspartyl-tRNA(Asn)/glutamyl-tRNA(Gln) amidotransferase subunit B
VEVKNINSLRGVQRAIDFESRRQAALLSRGCAVERETRTFDARSGETRLLRSKEALLDYRFMPEPDLPWLVISEQEVQAVRAAMPHTPAEQRLRLVLEYGLSEQEAAVLQGEPGATAFFTRLVHGEQDDAQQQSAGTQQLRPPRLAYSWLTSELFGKLRRRLDSGADGSSDAADEGEGEDGSLPRSGGRRVRLLASSPVSSRQLGSLLDELQMGSISGRQAKQVLERMLEGGEEQAAAIVRREGWQQSGDAQQLQAWVDQVMQREQADVQRFLTRPNPRFVGFLVAAVMRLSDGRADPRQAAAELSRRLKQHQQSAAARTEELEKSPRG